MTYILDDDVKNDNDASIATRAGYLFRTRKSFPNEMTGNLTAKIISFLNCKIKTRTIICSFAVTLNHNSFYLSDAKEQQSADMTGNPLTRHLRSKSYLFRS